MHYKSYNSFFCGLSIIVGSLFLAHPTYSAFHNLPADITGYYSFVGKVPRGFENVDWISLATVDANGREAPLNGFLRLKWRYRGRFVNFDLVRPTIEGNTLTFKTKVVRGISYQFKGQFLKMENLQDNETVLKGHLIKFRSGKKVAECDSNFFYFTGD